MIRVVQSFWALVGCGLLLCIGLAFGKSLDDNRYLIAFLLVVAFSIMADWIAGLVERATKP